MAYREREAKAAAQIIEAQQVFAEYQRAEEAVRAFGFDFVWKARTDGEHLHKVAVDGEVLKDFGLRNAKLESIVRSYAEKKAAALRRMTTGLKNASACRSAMLPTKSAGCW
ncbi:hypothetical protein GmRootV213_50360 (plasmid) [Variovorax sp. V213]|uniref:hypothetical protein n=1 Tax=Variovorax sp. V213 TaxID=3065955 RepID=UPI0034E8749F